MYDPEMKTWYAESPGSGKIRMVQIDPAEDGLMNFFKPNGEKISVNL